MTLKVVAQSIELTLDDDEGLSSLFVKWGPVGQYIDLTREEDGDKVYCELFDQATAQSSIQSGLATRTIY